MSQYTLSLSESCPTYQTTILEIFFIIEILEDVNWQLGASTNMKTNMKYLKNLRKNRRIKTEPNGKSKRYSCRKGWWKGWINRKVLENQRKQLNEKNAQISNLELRLDELEKKYVDEKKSKDKKIKELENAQAKNCLNQEASS